MEIDFTCSESVFKTMEQSMGKEIHLITQQSFVVH